MKKQKKLFSLISVLVLCIGMTLLTTNKINVNAQVVELSANVDLPLSSGFYVYNNVENPNLYFLYNSADSGGKHYYTDILFKATVGSGGGDLTTSMNVIIESSTYEINDMPTIESIIYGGVTSNALIDITLKYFVVYDVTEWFYRERGILDYIQIQRAMYEPVSNLYINDDNFLDLDILSNTLLKDYGIDVSYSAILNHDRASDYYYDEGRSEGYDEGYTEGNTTGYNEGYEQGLLENAFPSPTEYFLFEFGKWITPVIAIVIFGGGLFMFFTKKRSERYHG